jgi:hypothetical protein
MAVPWYERRMQLTCVTLATIAMCIAAIPMLAMQKDWLWVAIDVVLLVSSIMWLIRVRPQTPVR